jgi:hypothetical protein
MSRAKVVGRERCPAAKLSTLRRLARRCALSLRDSQIGAPALPCSRGQRQEEVSVSRYCTASQVFIKTTPPNGCEKALFRPLYKAFSDFFLVAGR